MPNTSQAMEIYVSPLAQIEDILTDIETERKVLRETLARLEQHADRLVNAIKETQRGT